MIRREKAHGRVLASQIKLVTTGEPVESIALQEERFLELEKRLTKKEAAAAPNEAERNGYQKEALHESASEAKKTLETSAKTAAANSHDEPPQQKTAAANEETEIHNSKIALTSHRSRKQLQQRSERQGSTRRQGRVIATRQPAKMDSKDDELKALIVKRKAMDNENKDQLNNSEA